MRSGASNEIQMAGAGAPRSRGRACGAWVHSVAPGRATRRSLFTSFAGLISRPAERVGGGFLPLATRRRAHPCEAFSQGAVSHSSGRDRADHLFARTGGVGLGLKFPGEQRIARRPFGPFLHVHFTRPHARPASRNAGNMPEPKMGLTMQNQRSPQCPAF